MEPSSFYNLVIFDYTIGISLITLKDIIELIILCLLLLSSGLISGSEIAFFSLTPSETNKLKETNNRWSNVTMKLLDDSQSLLATILIGNNFVNICIVVLSTYLTNSIFDFSQAEIIGFAFEVVFVTFMLLLFGEIIPKLYAAHNKMRFISLMCFPLFVMGKMFVPLIHILMRIGSSTNKQIHTDNEVSMEDISYALDITSEDSISSEKEILENIVKLKDTEVEEIMTSRVDVVAIDISKSFKEIQDKILECGYSRIPVYKDTFDNVKGVLYVKDLLAHNQKNNFRWQTLIRPPYYVPYSKKIDDLLEEFQKSKIHFAIVIDEYGGTLGIVTLDDILSEIVGNFTEEVDEEVEYTKLSETEYLFDGKILLNDFFKVLDIEDTTFDKIRGDADTLAGMILEIKGDFPLLHEQIKYENYIFEIEAEDKRRIQKIKVVIK